VSVVGIGVDVCEISRMARALERTPSLAQRLFTDAERADCRSAGGEVRVGGLAARFAAKEAVAKALGTGIRGFAFRDLEVGSDPLGRPTMTLHGPAAALGRELGVGRVHISLSTGVELAVANAVLESR
jgi:holo-[acyl-carrier protein] synthase